MTGLSAAAVELARMTAERDRLAGWLDALGAVIDRAEAGAATVVPIDVVRAHLGRPRPAGLRRERAGAGR